MRDSLRFPPSFTCPECGVRLSVRPIRSVIMTVSAFPIGCGIAHLWRTHGLCLGLAALVLAIAFGLLVGPGLVGVTVRDDKCSA